MLVVLILFFILVRCWQAPFSFGALTDWLHRSCMQQIPVDSEWHPIYTALVCGENLPNGPLRQLFTATGIIHLMVISGAHLIFIERVWDALPKFRFKYMLLGVFLSLYALSAGLRPPVVRALFSLILRLCNKKFKYFLSPYQRVQMSGMLCLVYNREWVYSISLQLSWLASLGMANRSFSRLASCTLTYCIILPVVSAWGGLHPLSILINWVLAPLASAILLPLSMGMLVFPKIHLILDRCWSVLIEGLRWLRPLMEEPGFSLPTLHSMSIWIYIWILFIVLQISFVYTRQRS